MLTFEPQHFNGKESEVAITTKPANNVIFIYGFSIETMHTAGSLLDTRASANFVHPPLILTGRKHEISLRDLPRLRTAAGKPIPLGGLILLHLQ